MSVPALQVIDITKYYDVRVRRITTSMDFRNYISVLRGKRDRQMTALDHVNFTIEPGLVFGLLGPNGAGKTTLIKILSTLVLPDSGQALVFGTDAVKHPRAVLKMLQAVLAEGWGFERRLTGRQNLEFYATLYGIPRESARKRIEELLEFCQLGESADVMFQKYSTGMTRKLLVGRALLTDASVLLFDEPTSGLDPNSAADFRGFLKNVLVRERGKTLIWATHNLYEAQQVCDTIGVLNKGHIIATGTPSEVRNAIAEKVNMTITVQGNGVEPGPEGFEGISHIGGVTKVETRKDPESANLMLAVEATRDVDYNRIFETLSSMGQKVVGIEASQPSLEEAFIRLTKGDKS
ncbi:MAG: ABC transporter ATP-binding protein [Thaumarchaeota archaeon]|nr:ABC transporter ATP-binding protein [Nitrososphaerota archaeon]